MPGLDRAAVSTWPAPSVPPCTGTWLLNRHKTEAIKFLAVLEALAPKRPEWVWPRLRTLLTDPSSDLTPMTRSLRLAARRVDWPERLYPAVRPVVRHRWGREGPRNKEGFELQAAPGRLTAASWLTAGVLPSPDAVLAAAVPAAGGRDVVSPGARGGRDRASGARPIGAMAAGGGSTDRRAPGHAAAQRPSADAATDRRGR